MAINRRFVRVQGTVPLPSVKHIEGNRPERNFCDSLPEVYGPREIQA